MNEQGREENYLKKIRWFMISIMCAVAGAFASGSMVNAEQVALDVSNFPDAALRDALNSTGRVTIWNRTPRAKTQIPMEIRI